MKRRISFVAISLIFLSILYVLPVFAAWAPAGLEGQDVLALTEDPTAITTWYAGTASGWIYKYTEANPVWTSFSTGLPVGYAVLSISIDPSNPDIVYAGLDGAGIYKTTDGGLTWTLSGLDAFSVKSIELDPYNSTIIFAATNSGIYKSTDSGVNWILVLSNIDAKKVSLNPPDFNQIPLPDQTDIIYAEAIGGLYKSTDGGTTWSQLDTSGLSSQNFSTIIAASDMTTLYAGTTDAGVFKSADGGVTWAASNDGLSDLNIKSLTFHPNYSNSILAVTGNGIYRTDHSGQNWYNFNSGNTATKTNTTAFLLPQPSYIFAGTSNGVISFDNSGPDLIVTSVTGPASANSEDIITVTANIRNQGEARTGGGFTVSFRLSTDTIWGNGNDIGLGEGMFTTAIASMAVNFRQKQTARYLKLYSFHSTWEAIITS